MTKYLPSYSKGKTADPSLVFALGLSKDGPTFRSDDAAGHLCTKSGSMWTSLGYYSDGVDDGISCGSTDISCSLNMGTGRFSIACWILLTNGYTKNDWFTIAMEKFDWGNPRRGYSIGVANDLSIGSANRAVFMTGKSGTSSNTALISTMIINDGVWRHFVGIAIPEAGHYLYVNGVYNSTAAWVTTGHSQSNTYPLYLGRSSSRYWPGKVALPKVYNRVLSPPEIRALYENERVLFR